jgi:polyferredoxin
MAFTPRGHNMRITKTPALIRFFIALAVLVLFVYVYLSPGISVNGILTLLVKFQFSTGLYGAGIAGLVLAILVLTLVCGRLSCSILCPLGTAQELFWRFGALMRRKKGKQKRNGIARTGYRPAPMARYAIPLLTGLGVMLSFTPLMVIFDPISTFGRGVGALRGLFSDEGAAAFTLILAVPMVIILLLALIRGRAF